MPVTALDESTKNALRMNSALFPSLYPDVQSIDSETLTELIRVNPEIVFHKLIPVDILTPLQEMTATEAAIERGYDFLVGRSQITRVMCGSFAGRCQAKCCCVFPFPQFKTYTACLDRIIDAFPQFIMSSITFSSQQLLRAFKHQPSLLYTYARLHYMEDALWNLIVEQLDASLIVYHRNPADFVRRATDSTREALWRNAAELDVVKTAKEEEHASMQYASNRSRANHNVYAYCNTY